MSILSEELANDPAGLGYAALIAQGSDNAIADLLNAPRYSALGGVNITNMLIWIAKHGIMKQLRDAAAGADATIASIAEVAILLVNNPNISSIDLGLADVQNMLGLLAQAGVIPSDAYQELLGLAAIQMSRAKQIGLRAVTADDVSRAIAEG